MQEPKDPLENLCVILDRLARLDDENKFLKNRVDFLERQDALQRIIINSTQLQLNQVNNDLKIREFENLRIRK